MIEAKLSILGLMHAGDVFERLIVPAAVDRDVLIDSIVFTCADLELLYPDFDTMTLAIGRWSEMRTPAWLRMIAALNAEYDPLHNFNRHEEYTDTATLGSATTTNYGSTEHGTGSSAHKVNAFNSGVGTDHDSTSGESSSQRGGSDTTSRSGTDSTHHTGHLYGNIGVTKSQEMLRDEISVRGMDIYAILTHEFCERFCLLVY